MGVGEWTGSVIALLGLIISALAYRRGVKQAKANAALEMERARAEAEKAKHEAQQETEKAKKEAECAASTIATFNTSMKVDMEYLKRSADGTNARLQRIEDLYNNTQERLARVEESAKSAHNRITEHVNNHPVYSIRAPRPMIPANIPEDGPSA